MAKNVVKDELGEIAICGKINPMCTYYSRPAVSSFQHPLVSFREKMLGHGHFSLNTTQLQIIHQTIIGTSKLYDPH